MKKLLFLLPVLFGAIGCNEEPKVTSDEEKVFRNPPKEMPAAAREGMQKGLEEAAKRRGGG